VNQLVYESRVDTWLAGVLILGVIAAVTAAVSLIWFVVPPRPLAAAVIGLLGAALPLWVMLSTRYALTDSTLLVSSGPFRWRVPVQEIRGITPTRSPLSSPALSLDRLRIEYGRGSWLMISPRDKDGFLRELAVRRGSDPA
jgi:hypothetical protein